jgi:hypothetical protein
MVFFNLAKLLLSDNTLTRAGVSPSRKGKQSLSKNSLFSSNFFSIQTKVWPSLLFTSPTHHSGNPKVVPRIPLLPSPPLQLGPPCWRLKLVGFTWFCMQEFNTVSESVTRFVNEARQGSSLKARGNEQRSTCMVEWRWWIRNQRIASLLGCCNTNESRRDT